MKKIIIVILICTISALGISQQNIKTLSTDNDWGILVKSNISLVEKIIESNIDVRDRNLFNSDKFYTLIGITKKEALSNLVIAKTAAVNLNTKYFSKDKCVDCGIISDDKWEKFASQIELFRKDKAAYQKFLSAVNYSKYAAPSEESLAGPGCNNWRFYVCGAACVLSCELPPLFAACLLACSASYC